MKSTLLVNGGAMPKINRSALMTRAWAIFRQTYCYPQIKFSDIGRKCFAWALRQAWAEVREVARVAAMTPTAKAERIETLHALIAHAGYIDSGPQWKPVYGRGRDKNAALLMEAALLRNAAFGAAFFAMASASENARQVTLSIKRDLFNAKNGSKTRFQRTKNRFKNSKIIGILRSPPGYRNYNTGNRYGTHQ